MSPQPADRPTHLSPGDKPLVTVVLPMLNELGAIEKCLDGFRRQTYGAENLDVVVVDGGSTDGSREWVDAYCNDHSWCRVVENPKRKAASGFNHGVNTAKGDVLVIFSSHGEPFNDYVEQSVSVLVESGVAGVGGRYLHQGTEPISNAIGLAMVSPFGMASPHRTVTERAEVDTISHPAYVTAAMRDIGPFDETLERNADYEFNFRMREAGYKLLVDPAVKSIYHPRSSLKALARQFWWYERWKERVIRRHPGSMKARHAVPPLMVSAAILSPLLATSSLGRKAVATGAVGYAGVVVAAVLGAKPSEHQASAATLAACFPIMHGAWGAGMVTSFFEDSWKDAGS